MSVNRDLKFKSVYPSAQASEFIKSSKVVKVHVDSVDGIVWIKDDIFVTGSHDGELKMINIDADKGLEVMGVYKGHKGGVYSVATTVNHDRIVSCSGAETSNLIVWDTHTFKPITNLITSSSPVFHVSVATTQVMFNPPGCTPSAEPRTLVLSGSRDGKIRIHDINIASPLAVFQLEANSFSAVTHTAFCPQLSPSKSLFAAITTTDGSLHMVEISEKSLAVGRVPGLHGGEGMLSARFINSKLSAAPRLLTTGKDGLIKLFDLKSLFKAVRDPSKPDAPLVTAQPSTIFQSPVVSPVRGTRMNANGDKFVSFSTNGDVKVWALDPLLDAKLRFDKVQDDIKNFNEEKKIINEQKAAGTAPANTPLVLEHLNKNLKLAHEELARCEQRVQEVRAHKASDGPLIVRPLQELLGHSTVASGAVWAPHGGLEGTIVTASWDCSVKIFEL